MSRITIKNVAEKAGVSVTSVSRVLNNKGYISEDLRNKVMSAIAELNYTPNEIARSFYKRETKTVALIVPTVNNPFFSELAFHIERALTSYGYHLYLGNSMNDVENEKEYLKLLKEQRVDGMIVGSHNINIEEYNEIFGNIVSVERKINDRIPMIESDNYQGGEIATKELINNGCKNIVCIVGSPVVSAPANNRVVGYLDVMKDHQLESKTVVIPFTNSEEDKINIIHQMFVDDPSIDGVVSSDDIIAAYILNVVKDNKIDVANNLKVIGFDGTEVIRNLFPELVTVVQPIEDIAYLAVKVLLKLIKGEEVAYKYTLPVKLYEK